MTRGKYKSSWWTRVVDRTRLIVTPAWTTHPGTRFKEPPQDDSRCGPRDKDHLGYNTDDIWEKKPMFFYILDTFLFILYLLPIICYHVFISICYCTEHNSMLRLRCVMSLVLWIKCQVLGATVEKKLVCAMYVRIRIRWFCAYTYLPTQLLR